LPSAAENKLYSIKNDDIEAVVAQYGATLVSLKFKGKEMTLNRDPGSEDFRNHDLNPHYGATCGRVGGRIADAKFTLENGSSHTLAANNGANALHGGIEGYSRSYWNSSTIHSDFEVKDKDGNMVNTSGVSFLITEADGHEGYPGTCHTTSYFLLSKDN